MKPHNVLCSVDKLNLVLYYFDDDGGVSTLLQHWVAFPKILKEMNKKKLLWKQKSKRIKKNLKVNSAYIYHIGVFYSYLCIIGSISSLLLGCAGENQMQIKCQVNFSPMQAFLSI